MNNNKNQSEMLALIQFMAEMHEHEISDAKAQFMAIQLGNFSAETINKSWSAYLKTPGSSKMPTIAQLLEHIQDGRPTAQQSWAMIPKNDEDVSVFMTEEMRLALGACHSLIKSGDITAAFFAYREEYDKLVLNSREQGLAPRWSPSFGHYLPGRAEAAIEAVEKSRISLLSATKFYPQLVEHPRYEALLNKYGDETMKLNGSQTSALLGHNQNENKEKIKNLMLDQRPGSLRHITDNRPKLSVEQERERQLLEFKDSKSAEEHKKVADALSNIPSAEERKRMTEEAIAKFKKQKMGGQ